MVPKELFRLTFPVILAICVYWISLSTGFQSDDFHLVDRIDREGFFASWGGPDGDLFLRPGTVLSLMADRAVWGGREAGFHATNLLLHVAASLLVYALARRVFECAGLRAPESAACLAACLFAVLPCHSESVCWVSGRTDLLAAVLGLGATLMMMRGRTLAALLLWLAGVLCKESLATVPAAWALIPASRPGRGRGNLAGRLALLAIPAAYAGFRMLVSPGVMDGPGGGGMLAGPDWSPGENLFRFVVRAFLPPLPSGLLPALSSFPPALALAAALPLVILAAILFVRRKPAPALSRTVAALCVGFLVLLLPVMGMKVALFDTQSERLLYIPGIPLLLASILILVSLAGEGRTARAVLLAAVAGGLVSTLHLSAGWARAGRLCDSLTADILAQGGGRDVVILNIPDNLNGAYVFRNGLNEAVRMAGGSGRCEILSTHSISSVEDRIAVDADPGSVRLGIPPGERFCAMGGIAMVEDTGETVIDTGLEEGKMLFYSDGSLRPAFGIR
ncbi:MAG: hypothetical protein QUS11_00980 [Candidatus Fermentibacter sp.]|nr:hypothetical protein [Candidatus Fermentibacter sp.]